jgi:hypothetical protein
MFFIYDLATDDLQSRVEALSERLPGVHTVGFSSFSNCRWAEYVEEA